MAIGHRSARAWSAKEVRLALLRLYDLRVPPFFHCLGESHRRSHGSRRLRRSGSVERLHHNSCARRRRCAAVCYRSLGFADSAFLIFRGALVELRELALALRGRLEIGHGVLPKSKDPAASVETRQGAEQLTKGC